MGCRLFDRLSRTSSGVQDFRTILLKKTEADYRAIYNALDLYEEASERWRADLQVLEVNPSCLRAFDKICWKLYVFETN